jgi:hypothetical protein
MEFNFFVVKLTGHGYTDVHYLGKRNARTCICKALHEAHHYKMETWARKMAEAYQSKGWETEIEEYHATFVRKLDVGNV